MALVAATLRINFTTLSAGPHRACYRQGVGAYTCVEISDAVIGVPYVKDIAIQVDDEGCGDQGYNGYVQALCEALASTNGREAFTNSYIADIECKSYTVECISGGITAAEITNPGTGFTSLPAIGFVGGAGVGATADATLEAITFVPAAAGSGYVPADTVTLTGGTFSQAVILDVATTKLISATLNAAGSDYAATDTITLAGGTFSSAAILTVVTTKLVSTVINVAGTGYNVADTITLAGGTFGVAAVITVDSVGGGGEIVTFSITTPGSYTVNSAALTQGATSGAGINATFQTSLFGVDTFTVSTPGVYTVNAGAFTQDSTSGSGTGATFNTTSFGVESFTVNDAGTYTVIPANPVAQGSTSGVGVGTSATLDWGVGAINMTAPGTGYTSLPAVTFTGGGGAAAAADAVASCISLTPPDCTGTTAATVVELNSTIVVCTTDVAYDPGVTFLKTVNVTKNCKCTCTEHDLTNTHGSLTLFIEYVACGSGERITDSILPAANLVICVVDDSLVIETHPSYTDVTDICSA